jgi:hypothetical protein
MPLIEVLNTSLSKRNNTSTHYKKIVHLILVPNDGVAQIHAL